MGNKWNKAHRKECNEAVKRFKESNPGKVRLWNAYWNAKTRCEDSANKSYKHYGGRGIEFRFTSIEQFIAELGAKPTPQHSVDRINNNGHYEPGNVRWATWKQQLANRRKTWKECRLNQA